MYRTQSNRPRVRRLILLSALVAGGATMSTDAKRTQADETDGGARGMLERTSTLPKAIASFGAAVEGQWLYVAGGHTGKAHQHSRQNLSSAFLRLNLLDGETWEKLPGGKPRQSVALAACTPRTTRTRWRACIR